MPNTRDQLKKANQGIYFLRLIVNLASYNSPIRRSYSTKRARQQSYKKMQKTSSTRKLVPAQNRGYSASKLKESRVMSAGSGSAQSPTFRPRHLSSTGTKTTQKSKIPKRPDTKIVIGLDKHGNKIMYTPSNSKPSSDLVEDKPKSYQRQRISLEDEEKTKEWLRPIISDSNLDLTQDPLRNGVLL